MTRSVSLWKRILWSATAITVVTCLGAASSTAASRQDAGQTRTHWIWPTPPPHRISRGFEAPATRYSAGHRGIDIAALTGTPLVAPADGTVYFVGRVVDRPVITLKVGDGLLVSIEPVEASVEKHEAVAAGSQIGVVGRGGHCDGSCIHLGVRLHGEYVSPMLYLGGIERAVLLPLSG